MRLNSIRPKRGKSLARLIAAFALLAPMALVVGPSPAEASRECTKTNLGRETVEIPFADVGLGTAFGVYAVGRTDSSSTSKSSSVNFELSVLEGDGNGSWSDTSVRTLTTDIERNWSPVTSGVVDPLGSFSWGRGHKSVSPHLYHRYSVDVLYEHNKYRCVTSGNCFFVGCPGGKVSEYQRLEPVAITGTPEEKLYSLFFIEMDKCIRIAPGTDLKITTGDLVTETTTLSGSYSGVEISSATSFSNGTDVGIIFGSLSDRYLYLCSENGMPGQPSQSGILALYSYIPDGAELY